MSPNTNPIPLGTCNFPVNMRQAERAFWAKLANGRSAAAVFREFAAAGLAAKDRALAAELERIRQIPVGKFALIIFAFALPFLSVNARRIRCSRAARSQANPIVRRQEIFA
jgi:hypothetical protein